MTRLVYLLGEALRRRALVSPQNSLILDDGTEFQPDIALLKSRDYRDDELAPGSDDALLVIEVSDTTVANDQQVKAPRYAGAGIPEYWLVNLPKDTVEVYSIPVGWTYQQLQHLKRGDTLELLGFSDVSIMVGYILG